MSAAIPALIRAKISPIVICSQIRTPKTPAAVAMSAPMSTLETTRQKVQVTAARWRWMMMFWAWRMRAKVFLRTKSDSSLVRTSKIKLFKLERVTREIADSLDAIIRENHSNPNEITHKLTARIMEVTLITRPPAQKVHKAKLL